MQDNTENKINNSLVPLDSKGLIRLEKSVGLTEKILKEQNDRLFILNWDILFKYKYFFNQFFSSFYSFTEAQLIDFCDKLIVGRPYLDLDDFYPNRTIFGLIFNENIIWTKKLKTIYYEKFKLLWDDSKDLYPFEIKFDKLPLSIIEEIERVKSIQEVQIVNGHHGCSEEDIYYLMYDLDDLEKSFSNILLKEDFSNEEILKVTTNNLKNYFGNRIFRERLIYKIHNDISDFNIEEFYSNVNI